MIKIKNEFTKTLGIISVCLLMAHFTNSEISVIVDYWEGSRSYILHIVSLDTDTLRVDII